MKNMRTESNTQPVRPKLTRDEEKASAYKRLMLQKEKDQDMVRGKFRYHEVPGGAVSFNFKVYKDQDVETYTFIDGEVYTIPLGVARHLNKNCWYPEYGYIPGEKVTTSFARTPGEGASARGSMEMRTTKKIQRMGFESLEFSEIEDVAPMASPIITVETI